MGSLELIARIGSQPPETPAGVLYDEMGEYFINESGQTVFASFLNGSGINDSNNYGIWAQDIASNLHLIIREGGQIEVAPGDFRTVSAIEFACCTNGDGNPNAFNARGEFAFRASFTDGSRGVFVSLGGCAGT